MEGNIYTKIVEIQAEMGAIAKDSKNPFFKSSYFDINTLLKELKPLLLEKGLLVLQPLDNISGLPAITTIVVDPETKETLEFTTMLPTTDKAQEGGSAITYYRRYALQSLFLIQAEDDDGNKASGNGIAI